MPIWSYFRSENSLDMPPHVPQTLRAEQRLKSRKRIAAVFGSGERLQVRLLRVHHLKDPARHSGVKAGFGVSARAFRRAVERNRVKRLMREAWRRQAGLLQINMNPGEGGLDVFLLYTGRVLPDYADLYGQVAQVIEVLMKRYGHAV